MTERSVPWQSLYAFDTTPFWHEMSRFDPIRGLVQTPVLPKVEEFLPSPCQGHIDLSTDDNNDPDLVFLSKTQTNLGDQISVGYLLLSSCEHPGRLHITNPCSHEISRLLFFSPTRLEIIPRYSNDDCGFEFKALSTGLIRYKYLSVLVVSYKICQSCFISIGMFQNLIFIRVWLSYICDCLLSRYLSNHYPQSRPFYSLNSFFLLYFFGPFI